MIKKDTEVPVKGESKSQLKGRKRAAIVVERMLSEPDTPINDIINEASIAVGTIDKPLERPSNIKNLIIKRPDVMAVLARHSEKAQENLVEIAEYSKNLGKTGDKAGAAYAAVAVSANDKILDRIHGKARQQVDITTKAVTLNIDLTAGLSQ